jgi:hypothetical protein
LSGELLVPYRSPQQQFTFSYDPEGSDKNSLNAYPTGVTVFSLRGKRDATVKYGASLHSFQLPETLIGSGLNEIVTNGVGQRFIYTISESPHAVSKTGCRDLA